MLNHHKKSINQLIHDRLIGTVSQKEQAEINRWKENSLRNNKRYKDLLTASSLTDQYYQYNKIDEKKAWKEFKNRKIRHHPITYRNIIRYAAIFIVPIFALFITLKIVYKPDQTIENIQEVYQIMARSEKMGKQKATLTLTDGEKIVLKATSTKIPKANIQEIIPKGTSASAEKQQNGIKDSTNNAPTTNNKLKTLPNSEYWITFEDGTVVHLNYNTTLRYPTHFSTHHRTVYLEGEAFFYVKKENKRPFRVVTRDGVITEYGTSFNVNTQTLDGTKVVLVTGSISVSIGTENKEQVLRPGELAVLQESNADIHIKKVNVDPYIAWNSGRFAFENYSLESLMSVLSRWYNMQVTFQSEDIRNIYFTGDIDRYESIVPVLSAIQNATGLEIQMIDNNIILRKPTINN